MADSQQEPLDSVGDTIARLERLWWSGSDIILKEFVPPPANPARQRVLVELIKVDQEYRWESGDPRPLEIYLSEWPELRENPDLMLELLKVECYTRGGAR